MKPVLRAGVAFIDGERYGLLSVSISDRGNEIDITDGFSGRKSETVTTFGSAGFSFELYVTEYNTPLFAGREYDLALLPEGFSYSGRATFVEVTQSAEIDNGFVVQVTGNFITVNNIGGVELLPNPGFQKDYINGVASGWELYDNNTTPTEQLAPGSGLKFQQILQTAGYAGAGFMSYYRTNSIPSYGSDFLFFCDMAYIGAEPDVFRWSLLNGDIFSLNDFLIAGRRMFIDTEITSNNPSNDALVLEFNCENTANDTLIKLYYTSLRKKIK